MPELDGLEPKKKKLLVGEVEVGAGVRNELSSNWSDCLGRITEILKLV